MRIGGLLLRWHRARPSDRLRFRLHARLRLSQHAAGLGRARPPDRPHLSRMRSAGAASASARCTSRSCCARRWGGSRESGMPGARRSTSPPATAATCSKRSRRSPIEAGLDPAARLQRHQRRGGPDADSPRKASTHVASSSRATRSTATASPQSSRSRRSGIVSGLYELFPDNTMVRRSLAGLAAAIEPGGYLIYTGQPGIRSSS